MAARVTTMVRQKMARDARDEREMVALKRDREMVEVPFEWQSKQTAKAILFPSYGWVPAVAVRWRKADGTVVPWSCGYQGDTFLMAREFAERRAAE